MQMRQAVHNLKAGLPWPALKEGSRENEVGALSPELQATAEMFKLRCRIYAQARRWNHLAVWAENCYRNCPQEPQFLIDWAWAEYNQGRRKKAALILFHESERFPRSEAVAYHLALVLASLERWEEARDWLSEAIKRSDEPVQMRLRAAREPEFDRMWAAS